MPRPRLILAGALAALVAIALALPALSLAGGSAGNQQYSDPFGSGTAAQSTSQSTPATTSTASSPSTSTAPADTVAPATGATTATTADPTATADTSTLPAGSLPYTGYDAWTAVGFGVALLGGGILLRRHAKRT